jgi:hypothetical protein
VLVRGELHLRRADEAPAALRRALADDLLELRDEGELRLLEALAIDLRQGDLEVVRRPDLADADRLAGVHLAEDPLRELDRLEAAPEGLREEPLHHAFEATFEVSEDRQGRSRFRVFPQVDDRTAGL